MQIDYRRIYGRWAYNKEIKIDLKKTAVVIIDMQPAFTNSRYGFMKAYSKILTIKLRYFDKRVRDVVLPNIALILKSARSSNLPVCYVVTYSEKKDLIDMYPWMRRTIRRLEESSGEEIYRKWSPGMEIYKDIKPKDDELVVVKRSGSAFTSSILPMLLRNMGVETILFTGCNTNGCVFSSALVAHEMGWNCVLVSDATACFTPELQELIEKHIFPVQYGLVMSTDEIVRVIKSK